MIDSPEAIRVLAAWGATDKAWAKAAGKPPADLAKRWRWLWKGVKLDPSSLARTARLSADQSLAMLRVLVAARVVYPDGTISKHASELVGNYVEKRLARNAPKAEPAPKTKAKAIRHTEGPRARACPDCGAKTGESCKMPSGKRYTKTFNHRARKAD